MLDLVSKLSGCTHGLCVCHPTGAASDFFLQLHYLSRAVSSRRKVVFLSSRLTEAQLRIACSKLAVRWDPSLIKVFDLNACLGDAMSSDVESTISALSEVIKKFVPSVIIFDDISFLERCAFPAARVVFWIVSLLGQIGAEGLVYVSSALKLRVFDMLVSRADFSVGIENVGSGYGKDVTGKMTFSLRSGSLVPEVNEILYLTGDRSVKCFYPGGVSILV